MMNFHQSSSAPILEAARRCGLNVSTTLDSSFLLFCDIYQCGDTFRGDDDIARGLAYWAAKHAPRHAAAADVREHDRLVYLTTYRFLFRLARAIKLRNCDVVCIFVLLRRFHAGLASQQHLPNVEPYHQILLAAYALIASQYDEYLKRDIWQYFSGLSYYAWVESVLRFCDVFDYDLVVTFAEFADAHNYLRNLIASEARAAGVRLGKRRASVCMAPDAPAPPSPPTASAVGARTLLPPPVATRIYITPADHVGPTARSECFLAGPMSDVGMDSCADLDAVAYVSSSDENDMAASPTPAKRPRHAKELIAEATESILGLLIDRD